MKINLLCAALLALAAAAPAGAAETTTFEQVLARPDDPDLNYRYALARIEAGDLLPALSALERVLAVTPGRYEALLLHALVLYRLESLEEASRELDVLERLPLDAGLRARIRELQAEINRRRSRFQVGARMGASFENNSNRKASPSSGRMLFFDRLLDVSGAAGKADTTVAIFTGIDLRQDLGSPKGHELSESFTYYRTEQSGVKALNLDAFSANVTGLWRAAQASAALTLRYDDVRLAREPYLRSPGASLRLERRSRRAALWLEPQYTVQSFAKNPASSGAPDRSGGQARAALGMELQAGQAMRLGAEYSLSWKNAAYDIYDYASNSLSLTHAWFPGGGAFLESFAACSLDRYPKANAFISRRLRKDTVLKAGVTLGLPLAPLWRPLRNLLFTASAEAQDYRSTITNYSYTNYKGAVTLSYRWRTGF